jgi:hypothetical protein
MANIAKTYTFANGTPADGTQVNKNFDDLLAGINAGVSATDKVLGRVSAGAGPIEEIPCTAAGRALIDDANAAAQIATLGLDADIATLALPASTTISAAGAELINDADAAAQRTTLGAAATSHTHVKANITDFPASMPASDVYAWAKAATPPAASGITRGYSSGAGSVATVTHGLGTTPASVVLTPAASSTVWPHITGITSSAFTVTTNGTENCPNFYWIAVA